MPKKKIGLKLVHDTGSVANYWSRDSLFINDAGQLINRLEKGEITAISHTIHKNKSQLNQ